MNKRILLLIILFIFGSAISSVAQKLMLNKGYVMYSTGKNKLIGQKNVQFAVKAGTADNTLEIFCDTDRESGPCAVAFGSLPHPIPKCDPAICLVKVFFIRDVASRYKMNIVIDGKPMTVSVKTYGPEFDQKMKSMSNVNFNVVKTQGN